MASWNRIAWTTAQDAEIRRVYETGERGGNRRLAERWNLDPVRISARAARLGLPPLICNARRPSGVRWQQAEIDLVRAHLDEPPLQIRARLYAKGFYRSLESVRGLIIRHRRRNEWPSRIDQIEDSDGLTVAHITAGLGVRRHTVEGWIKAGWLRAHRMGGDRLYVVRWADLRRFLIDHAPRWNPRKADRWFLIDALTYAAKPPARPQAAESLLGETET